MNIYTIYFEFFGKKMKHSVVAVNKFQALDELKKRLNVIYIDEKPATTDDKDIFEIFNNIFNPKQ